MSIAHPLPDPVSQLQHLLLETTDPRARARVHLDLARHVLQAGRLEAAARHLREALHFDPRLDAARALLSEVGPQKGSLKPRSAMRSLLDLFRRGEVTG